MSAPWRTRAALAVGKGLHWIFAVVGIVYALAASVDAFERLHINSGLALLALPATIFVAIVVHETGHVIGAQVGGMLPLYAWASPVAARQTRHGWQFGLHASPRGGGLTMAYPDFARPLRPQYLPFVVGGPVANLVVGALMFVPLVFGQGGAAKELLAGLGAINIGLGLANLVPANTSSGSTDGMHLLGWLRGVDESGPSFVLMRIMRLSLQGHTADEIPQELLDTIAAEPPPMPLLHQWFVLKARQNLGDFAGAAALEPEVDAAVKALPPAMVQGTRNLVSLLRTELRFSQTMAGLPLGSASDPRSRRLLAWSAPSLLLRCEALMAFEAGDPATAERKLEQSRRHAEDSLDLAVARSEARLHDAMRKKYA